jgi:hypothetical protein
MEDIALLLLDAIEDAPAATGKQIEIERQTAIHHSDERFALVEFPASYGDRFPHRVLELL